MSEDGDRAEVETIISKIEELKRVKLTRDFQLEEFSGPGSSENGEAEGNPWSWRWRTTRPSMS